jgi:hypothetical protein
MWKKFKNKEENINIENYLIKIGKTAKQNQVNRGNKALEMILDDEMEPIRSITPSWNGRYESVYDINPKDYKEKKWRRIYNIIQKTNRNEVLNLKELKFINKVVKKLDKKYWL